MSGDASRSLFNKMAEAVENKDGYFRRKVDVPGKGNQVLQLFKKLQLPDVLQLD